MVFVGWAWGGTPIPTLTRGGLMRGMSKCNFRPFTERPTGGENEMSLMASLIIATVFLGQRPLEPMSSMTNGPEDQTTTRTKDQNDQRTKRAKGQWTRGPKGQGPTSPTTAQQQNKQTNKQTSKQASKQASKQTTKQTKPTGRHNDKTTTATTSSSCIHFGSRIHTV